MNRKYLLGIIIIVLGALLLIGQTTSFNFWRMLGDWWPAIFVVMGLSLLSTSRGKHIGGLLITIVFGIILLGNLGVLSGNYWSYVWPLAIIAVGLWFIFGRTEHHSSKNDNSDDFVNSFSLFSGSNSRVISQNFRGANLTALFGGVDLDLRGADTGESVINIDAFAAFGGIDIKVPENWKVIITGIPLFGGWENKTRGNQNEDGPVIKIKCMVAFGGIDISN